MFPSKPHTRIYEISLERVCGGHFSCPFVIYQWEEKKKEQANVIKNNILLDNKTRKFGLFCLGHAALHGGHLQYGGLLGEEANKGSRSC